MKLRLLLVTLMVVAAVPFPFCASAEQSGMLSLTLDEVVVIALEQSDDIQLSQQDLNKSYEQIREAWADALPQVDLSAGYNRNWKLPSIIFDSPEGKQSFSLGTRNNFTGAVSLRQTLYAGGKVGAGLGVARLFRDFSEAAAQAARNQVVAQTKLAFYDLILARELVQVSTLALERAKANLKQVQMLNRAGRVSDYDLLRAGVQVTDLRPDSIRAQNNLKLAALTLKDVAGIHHEVSIFPVGTFGRDTEADLYRPEDLVTQALALRPEIRQARAQVQMQKGSIRIERAASRPSVELVATGQLEVQSNEFKFTQDDANQSWITGVSIHFPLFDGMRSRAKVAQAKVEHRRAEIEADKLIRTIRLEIQRTWLEFQEARERVAAREGAVDQVEEGFRLAELRYTSGVGTQLEILDAHLALIRAQAEHAQALRDRSVALVNLEYVVGLPHQADRK